MSLTFVNIKSGERRVCHTEPMIAAHLNTSDRNPNAMQGQDMGWRLAPETVVELERISQDPATLQTIAATFGILLESVSESDILVYISMQNREDITGAKVDTRELQRQYENDIARLRERDAKIEAEAKARGERKKVKPLVSETETKPTDEGLDNLDDIEELNEEIHSNEDENSGNIDEGASTTAKPPKKSTKSNKES
jgi:hypothetical protein